MEQRGQGSPPPLVLFAKYINIIVPIKGIKVKKEGCMVFSSKKINAVKIIKMPIIGIEFLKNIKIN